MINAVIMEKERYTWKGAHSGIRISSATWGTSSGKKGQFTGFLDATYKVLKSISSSIHNTRRNPPKNWNYLLEGRPLVVQASFAR